MRYAWPANSLKVSTIRSGAPSTVSEAVEPANMPSSKPRSSAMRAEIGSNTEPGWMQRSPERRARKRLRRSVQCMAFPPENASLSVVSTGKPGAWHPARRKRSVSIGAHKKHPEEMPMFDALDRQTNLTGNQKKIIAAAVIGDALEFFDYFLIGYVLAFVIGPWKLTFGQSAIVLLSSGVGAIIGAYVWGWIADRIGRRKVFIGTVLNFSVATGLLYFTPDNGWLYLTFMRFFVGVGVGGLYCVDLPLVQEFMPSSKRGWVGGLVTCVIPLGTGLGAVLGAFVSGDQWRLLFAVGVLPALLVLLVRLWVPESPRWLCRQGRYEEARQSLAWALQLEPSALPLPTAADAGPIIK